MKQVFTKVSGYFVKLDMPDPRTEWRRMAVYTLLVSIIGILFILLLFTFGAAQ